MRSNGEGIPVVALDIDGTLGDYHGNFLSFAERYFDEAFPPAELSNPGLKLWEWMGISRRDYQDAKLAYRQGGWKRWMPAYNGADRLTQEIRAAGAEVWICTTRPYLRLDNVDPDTREWLRRNGIQYDAVLFDRVDSKGSKYEELKRQAGDRVASILDDLPEMVQAAQDLQLMGCQEPILRDQPYNRHLDWPRRAGYLSDAWNEIKRDIETWRSIHE